MIASDTNTANEIKLNKTNTRLLMSFCHSKTLSHLLNEDNNVLKVHWNEKSEKIAISQTGFEIFLHYFAFRHQKL